MLTTRCFLAIKLDIEMVRSLSELQRELRNQCRDGGTIVKWVPPPNIHLTMRFLGQVTEPMVNALKEMLRPITAAIAPFQFDATGLGVFPNATAPRVIWAGVGNGADALTVLHKEISDRLLEAGFHLDSRPFTPHITIGRVKSGTAEPIASYVDNAELLFGATNVRNLYCYRSDLTTAGAEYHAMWRIPLEQGGRHRARAIQNETTPEETKGDPVHDDITTG
ncbi:MAG: RNA 2',3'-cyclic phosphodiesterase [Myxococcota bacterium]|nr:RNA 2',3'-cyclic phosphodiesterase [Myxococcota bacterium]